MKIKSCISIIFLSLILFGGVLKPVEAQQKKLPRDICINGKEQRLADALNDLRVSYGKKQVPLSKSLTFVARTHITDLEQNHPDTSVCNLSSWSDKGNWSPCCFNPYVVKHKCMWDKPKELTPYPYRGYELVSWFEDEMDIDSLISVWSETKEVLDMILTGGTWQEKNWRAMGLAVNDHYVSVWFGQRPDKEGKPGLCKGEEPAGQTKPEYVVKQTAYYLIFGSHTSQKEAKATVRKFIKEGYEHAGILEKNGRYRTYLSFFSNLKEAMKAKQQLPPEYKEAWILKH